MPKSKKKTRKSVVNRIRDLFKKKKPKRKAKPFPTGRLLRSGIGHYPMPKRPKKR